jgi:adenylate cyclase
MKKKEIELKFLVEEKFLQEIFLKADSSYTIAQGYIGRSDNVRVRCVNPSGECSSCITLKGDRVGISRDEFEYDIPYEEGISMLDKLCGSVILKTRYAVKHKKDKWEIDVFHGENSGLIIAELEIPKADYNVDMPEWMESWKPIADDEKYYNSYLAKNPYKNWSK